MSADTPEGLPEFLVDQPPLEGNLREIALDRDEKLYVLTDFPEIGPGSYVILAGGVVGQIKRIGHLEARQLDELESSELGGGWVEEVPD